MVGILLMYLKNMKPIIMVLVKSIDLSLQGEFEVIEPASLKAVFGV